MKSLQHVLWRGALALSLLAVGIGSGVGRTPADPATSPATCPAGPRGLAAAPSATIVAPGPAGARVLVSRRALTPAG